MGSGRRVIWTSQGQRTLEEIVSFLAAESPAAARQILSEALRAAALLKTFGERGRVVPEMGDPAVREIFVHRYRLMYRVTSEAIFVLAFIHGARDFAEWRRRLDS